MLDPVTGPTGQEFTYKATKQHRRKNGQVVPVIVWESVCSAPGCEESFQIKTPIYYQGNRSFRLRHCKAHRLTRRETGALLGNTKRKLTEAEVEAVRSMKGEYTAKEVCLVYPIKPGTVYSIWRGDRR